MEFHNDKSLFITAYDKYSDSIFRYCAFRVFDRERAKELMQETFTKTWEYQRNGHQIENIRAFLYKVAHNLCVNYIIRDRPFSLEEMSEKTGFDIEDNMAPLPENETEFALLMENIQKLRPEERELLKMRYIDDLKVGEIAEILNFLPNTISVKIRRAEEKLKQIYDKKNGKRTQFKI